MIVEDLTTALPEGPPDIHIYDDRFGSSGWLPRTGRVGSEQVVVTSMLICDYCVASCRDHGWTCEHCGHGLSVEQRCLARRRTIVCLGLGGRPLVTVASRDVVDMGALMAHVLECHLWWPAAFVEFVVGFDTFVHHDSWYSRSSQLLRELDPHSRQVLRVTVLLRQAPDFFPYVDNDGALQHDCICSFGGCCRRGRPDRCGPHDAPTGMFCSSCGCAGDSLCSRCGNPCDAYSRDVPPLFHYRACQVSPECEQAGCRSET